MRGHGVDVQLRAALMLALDPDPRLAERGKAGVTRLARAAARTTWRPTPPPELPVTAVQHGELTALAARAAAATGEDTSRMLTTWLARTPRRMSAAPPLTSAPQYSAGHLTMAGVKAARGGREALLTTRRDWTPHLHR
ncbi:hypothetical protein ACX27O_25510 [Micromonospora sp. SD19]